MKYLTLFLIQLALRQNLFARVQRPDRRQKAVQSSQRLLDFVPGQQKDDNGQCPTCSTTMPVVKNMSSYDTDTTKLENPRLTISALSLKRATPLLEHISLRKKSDVLKRRASLLQSLAVLLNFEKRRF